MTAARRKPPDGSWIRTARDEVGLDQKQLAELGGISRRSLAAYERGETATPPPKRVAIEQALRRRRLELEEAGSALSYAEGENLASSVADRVRTLEVLILRNLDLTERVLALVESAGKQLTELILGRVPREFISRGVAAELAGERLPDTERERLVAGLQAEAEALTELAGRLGEPASSADRRRRPRSSR